MGIVYKGFGRYVHVVVRILDILLLHTKKKLIIDKLCDYSIQ